MELSAVLKSLIITIVAISCSGYPSNDSPKDTSKYSRVDKQKVSNLLFVT